MLHINLIQISEQRFERLYFPYTAGLLQAYAQKYAQNTRQLIFRPIICERLLLEEYDQALMGADLVGFSVYIWNIQRSLALAKRHKSRNPNSLVVFGGPQIPHQPEAFLRKYPFIDLVALGEGEETFKSILEYMESREWQHIPGIAWVDQQTCFHQTPSAPRIKHLDTIPSPYLQQVFSPLMNQFPNKKWIATWETNRGCPFSCSFCDWGGLIQSRVYQFSTERLQKEINWFGKNQINDLFCADANFGMLKRDPEIVKWMGAAKKQYGSPHLFQTQTAKNIKLRNLEIQRLLSEHGLNPVAAISLQTLNQPTLKAIRRDNISTERYKELQHYCQAHQIFNYTDLIMAMPEESCESFKTGVSDIIQNGQHNHIMFNNAIVLPNAEMGKQDYQEKYGIKTTQIPFPGQVNIDAIQESLEIIIETNTLSQEDWIKMQVFAWVCNFLYFKHRLLQPICLFLFHEFKLPLKTQIEWFCCKIKLKNYPILSALLETFISSAHILQQGLTYRKANLLLDAVTEGVQLSPDLILQMELSKRGSWPAFFNEVAHVIRTHIIQMGYELSAHLFQDLLKITQANFYQIFYGNQSIYREHLSDLKPHSLSLRYTLYDYYQQCLRGEEPDYQNIANTYTYLGPALMVS